MQTSIYFTLNSHFQIHFQTRIPFYCSIHKYNTKFSLVKSKLTHVGSDSFHRTCFFSFFFFFIGMLHSLALFKNRLCEEEEKTFHRNVALFKKRAHLGHTHTNFVTNLLYKKKQIRSKCKINEAQTTNFSLVFE